MKILTFLLPFFALLAGCAGPGAARSDLPPLKLEMRHSDGVRLDRAWIGREGGRTFVAGRVLRRAGADDVTGHLDVTVYSADGTALRSVVGLYAPRPLPWHPRRLVPGSFRIELDPLPAAGTRLEIAAHDTPNH